MAVSAVPPSAAHAMFGPRQSAERASDTSDGRFRVDVTRVERLTDKLGAPIPIAVSPINQKLLHDALAARFTRPVGVPNNAPSELYAEIRIGNKIVGKVYTSGGSETPNDVAGRVSFGGLDEAGLHGPVLAQLRAEKIAGAMGGTIVKSDTAVTQAQFEARPPRQFYVDYEAMYAELERYRQSATERQQHYLATGASPAQSGGSDRVV